MTTFPQYYLLLTRIKRNIYILLGISAFILQPGMAQCDYQYHNQILVNTSSQEYFHMTFSNCEIDSFRVVVVTKFGDEVFVSNDVKFKWSPDFELTLSLTDPPQYIAIIEIREKNMGLIKERKTLSVYGGK